MSINLAHCINGDSAVKIADSVEKAIRAATLRSGQMLPPVRDLAKQLKVSPATVASAYRSLQSRGLIVSRGRLGTRVSHVPLARRTSPLPLPTNVRNLQDGNPDRSLLPSMTSAMAELDPAPHLYGDSQEHESLVKLMRKELETDGVRCGEITFVNGAMDGLERIVSSCLRHGDRVGVEDPVYGNVSDIVLARGMSIVPVQVDSEGMVPSALQHACREKISAVIITPRAQNPTGAATTATRARQLRAILKNHPNVLVIEDDHAAWICDTPLHCVQGAQRWAFLRSFSKALNPDFRLAAMTADPTTMTQVRDRMVIGERWVSHIVQRIACAMLRDPAVRKQLRLAAKTYTERRMALRSALSRRGITSMGESAYNVWIPVSEETPIVQALLDRGWAVAAGERFRISSPPAIRVTTATLLPQESEALAGQIAELVHGRPWSSTA